MSLFVTFEGPEGSGKSTQIRMLDTWLRENVVPAICTREPGGTPISEQIRDVLHDVQNTSMLPITEILLYSASRAQHVAEVIRPALNQGSVVISDRFAESTMAYQGYGHGLDLEMLQVITSFATGGLKPDLVIYFDLDVEIGLERKILDQRAGRGEWNRMDQQTLAFHKRVREGYLTMARQEPHRWLIVDATQTIGAIHNIICRRVATQLAKYASIRGNLSTDHSKKGA